MSDLVKVAVLLPHYNNIRGLKISLSSITNTEFVDVVIVDDGSDKDPCAEISQVDFPDIHQLHIIRNNENKGIEYVLNQGLRYIKDSGYKYVARLDCGDVCADTRFKKQRELLDADSDVFLVGSWASFVGVDGAVLFEFRPEVEHRKIREKMFISNQFCHPCVMFRVSALDEVGFYPVVYPAAEDYAYFFEFVKSYKTENIPEMLVTVEANPMGISIKKRKLQLKSRLNIIRKNFDFSLYSIYGIFRNLVLSFFPYVVVEKLKTWVLK